MTELHVGGATAGSGLVTPNDRDEVSGLLRSVVDTGVAFKFRDAIYERRVPAHEIRDAILYDLPTDGVDLATLVADAESLLLPLCKNEASPYFCGFGDTGADAAALLGGILDLFCQQNLINQSFDAPIATSSRSQYCVGCAISSALNRCR